MSERNVEYDGVLVRIGTFCVEVGETETFLDQIELRKGSTRV